MSTLGRFRDPALSGLYRADRAPPARQAAQESGLTLYEVALPQGAGKDRMLARIAAAFRFPSWFGGNWDALEDCLTDLGWTGAGGHLLLIDGAGGAVLEDRVMLEEVLASAGDYWAGRGRPFVAVLVGGSGRLAALDPPAPLPPR